MKWSSLELIGFVAGISNSLACSDCNNTNIHAQNVRHVRAPNATYGPRRALEWGQVNFLHTTDTHGWLGGHLKEANYGADWGDFVTFSRTMKRQADIMGVDLLILDTGDLHDGTGLSDTTDPNGEISMRIFERLEYDLLTIGNHELLIADVAYQTFNEIAKFWGDKYLTSNVQIFNSATKHFEYIGKQYKYFTTQHGLRIMAFGILFDMTRKIDIVKITKAKDVVLEDWFQQAINSPKPVDMFLVLGHNPIRASIGGSLGIIHDAIRLAHPQTPIQIFGGHTHIRDFVVMGESSTAIESGRYCETLGWVSMSGFNESNSNWTGVVPNPRVVPNPTRKATANSTSPFRYSRRYLDWNRATFEFHSSNKHVDQSGLSTTTEITKYREELELNRVYGCTPRDYCITCVPFNSSGSIFALLSQAMVDVVVNQSRKDIPRYVIADTGGVRIDLYKGPFTYDDFFTIMPSRNSVFYIPEVPCSKATMILDGLNSNIPWRKPKSTPFQYDLCLDPVVSPQMNGNASLLSRTLEAVVRRQAVDLTPGYTTTDDFGIDGDDTTHISIPYHNLPRFYQAAAGFRADGCSSVADVVFVDFAERHILAILGPDYSSSDVHDYISSNFSTHNVLPEFVMRSDIFQAGMPDCILP